MSEYHINEILILI